jgi:hypothetical protein
VIAALAGQGYDVKRCCRVLGVPPSSYFGWRSRPPSAMELRREWLRGLIEEIHAGSRGVYGYRRVRAEPSFASVGRSSSRRNWCTS